MSNEERLKNACTNILSKLKMLVYEIELAELVNTQWYLNFEDNLNELSIKNHDANRNS